MRCGESDAVSRDTGYESSGHHALLKENHMLSPLSILILACLLVAAILLVSLFLVMSDGANDYKSLDRLPEAKSSVSERGKNAVYGCLQSQDE